MKLAKEGNLLPLIKNIYPPKKSMANIILNDKKMNVFFIQSKIKQKCPFLPPLFNIMLKVLASAIRQGKEMKCIQIRKEEMKPPLFVDDMIFYIKKKLKEFTKISETYKFSKFTGYKINMQKSIAFLVYTSNEHLETEIQSTESFTIAQKKVKYLTCKSNNISLQDLNAKNCTTLMKADKWNKENLMDMAT